MFYIALTLTIISYFCLGVMHTRMRMIKWIRLRLQDLDTEGGEKARIQLDMLDEFFHAVKDETFPEWMKKVSNTVNTPVRTFFVWKKGFKKAER